MTKSLRYEIENIELNVATRELWREGARIPVEPQVFDLLLLLIENRDRVVLKDELVEVIWGGRAISDATLSSRIKAARRALGDDGQRQAMIKTVHRRGFRFVGPVERLDVTAAFPAVADGPPRLASSIQVSSAVSPGAGRGPDRESGEASVCRSSGSHESEAQIALLPSSRPSLAVLPIQAQGACRGLPIADGLHRDMTVQFARTRWLFVSARASVMALAAEGLEGAEIGNRLGARYLIDGALFVADDRIRVTVTLTDMVRRCEIWAERFERKATDIFEVQDEIVEQVVAAVEAEIESQERRRALLRHPASLDAWGAYHRALSHLHRFKEEELALAEEYLHLAVRLDPDSPRAFAALSFLHWQRAFLGLGRGRSDEAAQALDYAHQGLALDRLDPQCHWALGRVLYLKGDMEAAIAEQSLAVELSPSFAYGQYALAFGLTFTDRCVEGLGALDRARRLSPYDPMRFAFTALRAISLSFSGERAEAADWADRAVCEPNAHHHITAIAAWCNELAGRRERALGHVASLKQAQPGFARRDHFQPFPFLDRHRVVVDGALERLGV